jgi:hypothetical protein
MFGKLPYQRRKVFRTGVAAVLGLSVTICLGALIRHAIESQPPTLDSTTRTLQLASVESSPPTGDSSPPIVERPVAPARVIAPGRSTPTRVVRPPSRAKVPPTKKT